MVTLTLVSNGFVFILESTFRFSLQSLIYLYQLCPKGGWVEKGSLIKGKGR